jgi:hypothetical protein
MKARRVLVMLSIAFPLVIVAACDDDTSLTPVDAGSDVAATIDTGVQDRNTPSVDAPISSDAPSEAALNDASEDADGAGEDADADSGPPPLLCETYPENLTTQNFSKFLSKLYVSLAADCKIQGIFDGTINPNYDFDNVSDNGQPFAGDCFHAHFRALTGCKHTVDAAKVPYTYDETSKDSNDIPCLPPAGAADRVIAGFFNPKTEGTTDGDYTEFLVVLKAQVKKPQPDGLSYADADADRLVALLEALRTSVVQVSSAGFSKSQCPADAGDAG